MGILASCTLYTICFIEANIIERLVWMPIPWSSSKTTDLSQIMALAHQMYPQRTKYFLGAFTAATAQPHGYLVIDMKQETRNILRLRSQIFPWKKQIAYHPRLIQFYERCRRSNMVFPRLKKHANELVYLQKARPYNRNHIIDKADHSLIECLCKCAYNILKGNFHWPENRKIS